jgi:hypothetical protein
MLEILRRIAPVSPTKEMRKVLPENAEKLEPFVNDLKKSLSCEGTTCPCDDGKEGNCIRLIHNCQWATKQKNFSPQKNRCLVGSRIQFTASKEIVLLFL